VTPALRELIHLLAIAATRHSTAPCLAYTSVQGSDAALLKVEQELKRRSCFDPARTKTTAVEPST